MVWWQKIAVGSVNISFMPVIRRVLSIYWLDFRLLFFIELTYFMPRIEAAKYSRKLLFPDAFKINH